MFRSRRMGVFTGIFAHVFRELKSDVHSLNLNFRTATRTGRDAIFTNPRNGMKRLTSALALLLILTALPAFSTDKAKALYDKGHDCRGPAGLRSGIQLLPPGLRTQADRPVVPDFL